MEFPEWVEDRAGQAELRVAGVFKRIGATAAYNQRKVIQAMRDARVSDTHFAGTTGYGYNDAGRETLEKVYSAVFKTEAALVRHQIASGTHALGICLYGNLRPGDELLFITGRPYDTILNTIGTSGAGGMGSLRDFGVTYKEVGLLPDGGIDLDGTRKAVNPRTKIVMIQRSRGYSWRNAISIEDIGRAVNVVKNIREGLIVFVDNCYGEFVEEREPTEVGADIAAGSLIKNPGGGLAPSGGYVVGAAEFVDNAAYRLTVPGLGGGIGASHGLNRLLYQGFYLAPHVVSECLKSAVFLASLMESEGYKVSPASGAYRSDIVQAVELGTPERLKAFCEGIQSGSAVDSFVTPEPSRMPGYDHEVIMAAGAFIQGASIELSADGPMRKPYIAYAQGGLIYEGAKIGILSAFLKIRGLEINGKQQY